MCTEQQHQQQGEASKRREGVADGWGLRTAINQFTAMANRYTHISSLPSPQTILDKSLRRRRRRRVDGVDLKKSRGWVHGAGAGACLCSRSRCGCTRSTS